MNIPRHVSAWEAIYGSYLMCYITYDTLSERLESSKIAATPWTLSEN